MSLTQAFEMANDSEFRTLAAFGAPPRAGRVTALEGTGQVRVEMDDPDGGDVLAWPLNGATVAVNQVVYVLLAANAPDSGIVLGVKGGLPVYDVAKAREIRAADGDGLKLYDDAGNLGVAVADGGGVTLAASTVRRGDTGMLLDLGTLSITEGATVLGTGFRRGLSDGDVALNVIKPDETGGVLNSGVSGDSYRRFVLRADGRLFWGPGNATRDTELYRSAANVLRTPDNLVVDLLLGVGTASPQGKVHGYDGLASVLLWSSASVAATAVTIVANGTGDVVYRVGLLYVIENGGTSVAALGTVAVGGTLDVVCGPGTFRFAVAANGGMTVVRQAGTGTGRVAVLALWM